MSRIASPLSETEHQLRGPRVKLDWERTRKALKPRFKQAGIVECELRYVGCLRDWCLGFAHSLRRRNITTQEQMEECVLGCAKCHKELDAHGSEHMAKEVRRVISERPIQP